MFSKTTHTQAQIHWKITHQNVNRKYWCMVGFLFFVRFLVVVVVHFTNLLQWTKFLLWSENIITITEGAVQGGLGSGKTGGSEGISNSHVTHEMALNWNRVGSKSSRGIAGGQTIKSFHLKLVGLDSLWHNQKGVSCKQFKLLPKISIFNVFHGYYLIVDSNWVKSESANEIILPITNSFTSWPFAFTNKVFLYHINENQET